jgi:hypothetical protein
MVISDKQHQANRQNAQQSTGPKAPEGKSAVRFNALTYGLRTRESHLPTRKRERILGDSRVAGPDGRWNLSK